MFRYIVGVFAVFWCANGDVSDLNAPVRIPVGISGTSSLVIGVKNSDLIAENIDNSKNNQLWVLFPGEDDTVIIKNKESQKCISAGKCTINSRITIGGCDDYNNYQYWRWDSGKDIRPDCNYDVVVGKCNSGNNVCLIKEDNGVTSKEPDEEMPPTEEITKINDTMDLNAPVRIPVGISGISSLVIGVKNSDLITENIDYSKNNQLWVLLPGENCTVIIKNKETQKCISAGKCTINSRITIGDCDDNNNYQYWHWDSGKDIRPDCNYDLVVGKCNSENNVCLTKEDNGITSKEPEEEIPPTKHQNVEKRIAAANLSLVIGVTKNNRLIGEHVKDDDDQIWLISEGPEETLVIKNKKYGKCMSLDNKKVNLVLADCDDNNKNQFWRWDSEGMISPKFKEDNVVHIQIKHKNNVSLAKRINPYILKNFHLSQV